MIERRLIRASYSGTITEWDDLAQRLDTIGQTRTATAIRSALDKTRARYEGFGFYTLRDYPNHQHSLRFSGGTIAVIDELLRVSDFSK